MTGWRFNARSTANRCGENPAALIESLESRVCLATVVWDGGPAGSGTDWHDPVNWVGDVLPVDGDDVQFSAGPAVEFSSGILNLVKVDSDRPLRIRGGSMSVSMASTVSDLVTLDGGTLAGGPWILSGPGLTVTDDAANGLDGATISGDVTLPDDNAFVRVTGGLTVNGLVVLEGEGSRIVFDGGVQSLAGNADFVFTGFAGQRTVTPAAGSTLTIAPGVSFTGQRGRIGDEQGSIVNQGTIWADTAFGTIDVRPAILTNLGTLRASDSGVLRVNAGSWTNAGVLSVNQGTLRLGGSFDITQGIGQFSRNGGEVFIDGTLLNSNSTLTLGPATGTWRFGNGQIVGGIVELTGGATLAAYSQSVGKLIQLTVNGNLSWTVSLFSGTLDGVTVNGNITVSGVSSLTVKNGLTLNGTLTVSGADSVAYFDGGPQSLLGAASISLTNAEAYLWALQPLTIPSGVSVSGFGRVFGPITNQGTFTADTPGSMLIIGRGSFVNSGQATAAAGASLHIGESFAGSVQFTNSGTLLGAGDIRIGPNSASGPIQFTNSGLVDVVAGGTLRVGQLNVFNDITLNNTGTIEADGGHITIGSLLAFEPVTFVNAGQVSALNSGSVTFDTPVTTAQIGDVRATGGQIVFRSTIDNTGSVLGLNATTGSWSIGGGMIDGGEVYLSAGATLNFDNQPFNELSGVVITGTLTMAGAGARLAITNGLTVNGTVAVIGEGAEVLFSGGQSIGGAGTIHLGGAAGTQTLSAADGTVVTIGAGITISSASGDARLASVGSGSWTNLGTLGGKLLIEAPFSNAGIVEARDGQTMSIQAPVANYNSGTLTGGTWRVLADSVLDFGPGPITANHAVVDLSGSAASFAALNGLKTNSGTLTLASGFDLNLPGGLHNAGTLEVGPGSSLGIAGAFTQAPAATLKLKYSSTAAPLITAAKGLLTGALNVAWLDGYIPAQGLQPDFIVATELRGRFKTFTAPSIPSIRQSLVYTATGAAIQILPALPKSR